MRQRGCKEEFVPNPELLAIGQVDFLPAAALSEEELAKQRADAEALVEAEAASTRCAGLRRVALFILNELLAGAGWAFDRSLQWTTYLPSMDYCFGNSSCVAAWTSSFCGKLLPL